MATLTVRNLPDEVVVALKRMAGANHRSMEQEVRLLLESIALGRAAALDRIEASWDEMPREISSQEVDDWIRQSRP
jgi:plasmid stability protein